MCREYGWTIEYVKALPAKEASKFQEAANILKAKDRLHELAVQSYPHMKKEHRDKYKKQLERQANPPQMQKTVTAAEMAAKLGKINGGFGN